MQVAVNQQENDEQQEAINVGKFVILKSNYAAAQAHHPDDHQPSPSNELKDYFQWKMNALDEAKCTDHLKKKSSLPKIQIFDPRKY